MSRDQKNEFTDFTKWAELDPAVSSLLERGKRRRADARLPIKERSRQKKERERAQARKPRRINLDLPEELKAQLVSLAKREDVPISQLVAFLLLEPVQQLSAQKISPWAYKLPSGCPKFLSVLDLEPRAKELSGSD